MYRTALLFLLCVLGAAPQTRAQSGFTITGAIVDTLNRVPLHRASVVLVRAKDSVLATFTRTDSGGNFVVRTDSAGVYKLLVTYPNFADYTDRITVGAVPVQLGIVPMISGQHLLQEFVLTKRAAAIVIRGDTTEYNADSFKVRAGATVEDLLKKLPGLQIDKDGKITAQGETVQKILVDGEEFFSDDPAVVTKNLQAAALDKVQVFDKKSDAATFTGIDDGERTKTINLQLKENMKRGLFGKAVLGAGPELSRDKIIRGGFFENQVMVNAFRGKRQLSAFGIMSNTGVVGLSWQDGNRYGSGNSNMTYDEESGMSYFENSSDDDGMSGYRYSGEGLPTAWTGGLHYADRLDSAGAHHVSANYRFAKTAIDAAGTTTTQYILPDSGYVRRQDRATLNTSVKHGADGLYEWKIDTSSNLKLTASGSTTARTTSGFYNTDTRGASGALINKSSRIATNTSTTNVQAADLGYRKKFKKTGRNISITLRENYRASDGSGTLASDNLYFTDGLQAGADSIHQLKKNTGLSFSLNGRASYTEPLSKTIFLTVRTGATMAANASERLSFNRAPGGDWSATPDSLFSSSYAYDIYTQDAGLSLRYVYKKYNIALGGDAFRTQWTQHDRLYGTPDRSRDYNNYAPSASLRYNFTKHTYIFGSYAGSTRQPSLEQLQPLQQNTDPFNISVGNPDLRQEFDNAVRVFYHSAKPISNRYMWASVNGTFVNDDITRSETFDALGRRRYQYINVDGNRSLYGNGGIWTKWKAPDLSVSANVSFSANHGTTYVNGLKNVSDNNTYSVSMSFDKEWKKGERDIAGLTLNPELSYADNKATLSTFTQSYYTAEVTLEGYAELFWKLQLRTTVWYNYRQKTEVFPFNNNVVRWDLQLNRKFGKGDAFEARLSLRDVLDQNIGYTRFASDNSITENRYNTIRRYGLLSLTWNIARGPDAKLKSEDDEDE